jgi:hypothetical protein
MKQPNSLVKLTAVVSSVLLAGGFVCYRAGAFDWLRETNKQPVDAGSKRTPESQPTDDSKLDPSTMGGWKSLTPLVAPRP